MKIYLLGGGASKSAGYPLTNELFSHLEAHCKESKDLVVSPAWTAFADFCDKTQDPAAKALLTCPNPELALSLLDLYSLTRDEGESRWWDQNFHPDKLQATEPHPYDTDPPHLFEAQDAIRGLLICLRDFFDRQHWLDTTDERKRKRKYLEEELSSLEPGDVVITTNWDSLAERVLLEQGRWTPADGFGFPVSIKPKGVAKKIPAGFPRRSEIRVLKLHGSFGWSCDLNSKKFYLRYANYLQHLAPLLSDAGEPFNQPTDQPVLIYPTYLKRLDHEVLQKIWTASHEALLAAEEIRVLGYSLPSSDTPTRILLNSVRRRLESGATSMIVYDRDPDMEWHWKAFLPKTVFKKRQLG